MTGQQARRGEELMEKGYIVKNQEGRVVLQADGGCQYPKRIELQLIDAGYTIWLDGRKLTKKEVRG